MDSDKKGSFEEMWENYIHSSIHDYINKYNSFVLLAALKVKKKVKAKKIVAKKLLAQNSKKVIDIFTEFPWFSSYSITKNG